jgi:hypothetical protein
MENTMNLSLKLRIRILFLAAILLISSSACGSSSTSTQKPKPSATPKASLEICLPSASEYKLEITDLNDASNKTKRSCNARGRITNTGNRDLMFRVYRVNHYGAEEHFGEKWMGAGYQILKVGESTEYGRFHRCTGSHCGEGEWFYIEKIGLYYYEFGCPELAHSVEEPHPESIILIENPCSW